jgi:uncharacterized protein YbjT (DUF2867 family)
MKILLFGATGMVGQGVLRECFRARDVESVLAVGRTSTGIQHPKLRELLLDNPGNLKGQEETLRGCDACFFPLGVSSGGMTEDDYTRITYDLTLSVASFLAALNPGMTFVYVSGAGTDSSERGKIMWARVKGRTENALLRLPLAAYMFRPGLIRPLDGIHSKTPAYRLLYTLSAPLLPLLHRFFPAHVLSTREVGQAMLAVARRGYPTHVLETRDLRALVRDTFARPAA